LTKFDDIYAALAHHVGIACRKLRQENLDAQYFCVYLATSYHKNDFYSDSLNVRLPFYSSYTPDILKYSKMALKKIFKENKEYKKCGFLLFDLRSNSLLPSNLFDQRNLDKENSIISVVDKLNTLKGMSTINFGDMFLNEDWKPKRCNVSAKYTTSWDDLIKVN